MAFCIKCGTKLRENASFCSNCGSPVPQSTLEEVQPEIRCDAQTRASAFSKTKQTSSKLFGDSVQSDSVQNQKKKTAVLAAAVILIPFCIFFIVFGIGTAVSASNQAPSSTWYAKSDYLGIYYRLNIKNNTYTVDYRSGSDSSWHTNYCSGKVSRDDGSYKFSNSNSSNSTVTSSISSDGTKLVINGTKTNLPETTWYKSQADIPSSKSK